MGFVQGQTSLVNITEAEEANEVCRGSQPKLVAKILMMQTLFPLERSPASDKITLSRSCPPQGRVVETADLFCVYAS